MAVAARGRERCCASCSAVPRGLQGAVPAGRRHRTVRRHPDEPGARRGERRLPQHRRLVEEGDRRGAGATAKVNVAADEARLRATPPCRAPERCKLTPGAAYVHYTPNETIGGVEFPYVPDSAARAAGGRHVLDHPVAARSTVETLRRSSTPARRRTSGPPGLVRRDRARGSARHARAPARPRCGTTRPWRMKARCSTRRRPSRWYCRRPGASSGCRQQGGLAGDGGAQSRQGAAAVRGDRRLRLLPQSGRPRTAARG